MKILANYLDTINAIATLDNSPFNGYTFEFNPEGELEGTFLWRNGHMLDIENSPLVLPKRPPIIEASHIEEIELPNDDMEFHYKGTPFTGTALLFIDGKLAEEVSFDEGSEIDPTTRYHPNGFLKELVMEDHRTSWLSNGAIELQYFSPPNKRPYVILYDDSGNIRDISLPLQAPLSYTLIRSKKFAQKAILAGSGITNEFLLTISQWGALQDTKKLSITDSNISAEALIQASLQQLEVITLEDCPNIKNEDIETLSNLYPNLTFDTEYL